MNPPPPMLPALGCVTASANAVATAASMALPPFFRIAAPTSDAGAEVVITIPSRDVTGCDSGLLRGHALDATTSETQGQRADRAIGDGLGPWRPRWRREADRIGKLPPRREAAQAVASQNPYIGPSLADCRKTGPLTNLDHSPTPVERPRPGASRAHQPTQLPQGLGRRRRRARPRVAARPRLSSVGRAASDAASVGSNGPRHRSAF